MCLIPSLDWVTKSMDGWLERIVSELREGLDSISACTEVLFLKLLKNSRLY